MRWVMRILKVLLIATGALLALIVGTLGMFWLKPSVFVNDRTVTWALHRFAPVEAQLRWEKLSVSADSESFWKKRIVLHSQKLCLEEQKRLHVCLGQAQLDIRILFRNLFPRLHVTRLLITEGLAEIIAAPAAPGATKKSKTSDTVQAATLWPSPPEFLSMIDVEQVNVAFHQVIYKEPSREVGGSLSLEGKGDSAHSEWNLKASARSHTPKALGVRTLNANVQLKSQGSVWFGSYFVKADADAVLPDGEKAKIHVHGTPKDAATLAYDIRAQYSTKAQRIEGNVTGSATATGVSARARAKVAGLAPSIPSFEVHECDLSFLEERKQKRSHFKAHCPFSVHTEFGTKTSKNVLRTLEAALKADVRMQQSAKNKGELDGTIELIADPLVATLKQGSGALTTKISGSMDQFPEQIQLDSHLELKIEDFQRLAQALHRLPWAIPEPFNSLTGKVHLSAQGSGKLPTPGGEFPIKLTSRLKADRQKLDVDVEGVLIVSQKNKKLHFHLQSDVVLSDVRLVLPPMTKQAPPRLMPDPRISKYLSSSAKNDGTFTHAISIYTPDKAPLRLLSNLAKDQIPISLDLRVTSETGLRGKVHISTFPVELFRRIAQIQHLNITLKEKAEDSLINGEIRVSYTDYTIRILILGLMGKPQVRFVSDPPLPEDQALAVLLFGKKLDALDKSQAASVGSAEAAVADGAVTLASMYLLASTPVESIGYNPLTRVFMAKIRLADGTSLNVGSDMNQLNEVGIRKQLGSHWAIASYLQHPLDPVQRSLAAFLEWSAGY